MNDVNVEIINDHIIRKYSKTKNGYKRLSRELLVLKELTASLHTPNFIDHKDDGLSMSIDMSIINGQSAKEWLKIDAEYDIKPIVWLVAKKRLKQYIMAEMDLLSRHAMYRDLNLEHLLFSQDMAYLVDHEATIINTGETTWNQSDFTGTWETMAPEEFPEHAVLSLRTATYRVAVFCHLALAGKLPFIRYRHSRAQSYASRKKHGPTISVALSRPVQQVFRSALSIKKDHRFKDPLSFFEALERAFVTI
jgi:serine/threonine protein kinase